MSFWLRTLWPPSALRYWDSLHICSEDRIFRWPGNRNSVISNIYCFCICIPKFKESDFRAFFDCQSESQQFSNHLYWLYSGLGFWWKLGPCWTIHAQMTCIDHLCLNWNPGIQYFQNYHSYRPSQSPEEFNQRTLDEPKPKTHPAIRGTFCYRYPF